MKPILFLLALLLTSFFMSAQEQTKNNNAVVLIYHHVSETTPASTSISPTKFAEHLEYIHAHHQVLPLEDIVKALQASQSLPANTLAITFDDGYRNILENAHPLLQEYKMPYTIFINPGRIGNESGQFNWQEITQMAKENVTFANHTMDHLYMLKRENEESETQWLNRVWSNVEEAQSILDSKLKSVPKYLAYPYGEYNTLLAEKVKQEGYIGFAQHSGAISHFSDFSALPRFPAAGIYANLNTLKTKMASLAMNVTDSIPQSPEVFTSSLSASFNVNEDDLRLAQLQCYYDGKTIEIEQHEKRVSFTLKKLPNGRSRVNCTAPSISNKGRYYWHSQPFFYYPNGFPTD